MDNFQRNSFIGWCAVLRYFIREESCKPLILCKKADGRNEIHNSIDGN